MPILPLIILQVLVFIGLVVAFWLLFHRQQSHALLRLSTSLKQTLAKEADLKKKVDEAAKLHENEREKGRQEAKDLAETAKKQAQQIISEAREKAHLEAERIIQKGKEEVERLRRSSKNEIQKKSVELAVETIKYTFGQKGKEALHKQIIEETINEISSLDKERFLVKTDNVLIKTASGLDDAQKERLKKALSDKIGEDVELKEQVNESLVAGFVVEIDSMVIDGSLKNKLHKAMPLLRDKS